MKDFGAIIMKCLKCMRKIADPKTGLCDDCQLENEDVALEF